MNGWRDEILTIGPDRISYELRSTEMQCTSEELGFDPKTLQENIFFIIFKAKDLSRNKIWDGQLWLIGNSRALLRQPQDSCTNHES